MADLDLKRWLAAPQQELSEAVAQCAQAHVNALRSQGIDFYGYALLPGEPYDLRQIAVVTNSESDLSVSSDDAQYRYYRYGVDEWQDWHGDDAYDSASALLAEANAVFRSMHSKRGDDFRMDGDEIAHSKNLLEAIVRGLELAKSRGVFGTTETFLVVWISDSSHPIVQDSVRRLNSPAVADEFIREFC